MTPAAKVAMAMDIFRKITQTRQVDITQLTVQTNQGVFFGRWFKNGVTGQKTLRGFDVAFHDGRGIVKVRFLEQNPDKDSVPGRRAKQGAQIVWAIDQKNNNWLFSVENGQIHPTREKAVSPVATPVQALPPATPTSVDMSTLPLVDDIPAEVLARFADEEAPHDDDEWA